ncbi:hydantoinase B/oxoprolinase family protein [Brachybacterium sp. YJGR34]|uniref:hydantoinase B/oxoprolinase family protein n=1 Tax=Brachybacterium sp. YJGR34 TaxID=2059911 RepID=UPI000E0A85E9|nr:hydantoinase B/oxoprolinase family protein [Brachybacterium sp. YJGR34]
MTTDIARDIVALKLRAASEEMCKTLQRTSRSLYVKETADFCCALADLEGRFAAYPRNIGVSGFVGLNVRATVEAAAESGPLRPGDVIIANDPYSTMGLATHLPDIQMIRPYFDGEEIIGYGWCFIHCSDIGGRVPSSISPSNDSVFAEGLQIPPVRIVRGGQIDPDVLRLVLRNSRTPEANHGDFQAMLAALETGCRRVQEILDRYGREAVLSTKAAMIEETGVRTRSALRVLEDGSYRFVDYLDHDGVSGVPVRISVEITMRDGTMHIDFTGTDPQVNSAFNVASQGTVHAWLVTRVLALVGTLDSEIHLNAGLTRDVTVNAPHGSLVNAQRPSAVGVRHASSSRVNDALSGALVQAAPQVVPAASSGLVVPVVLAEQRAGGDVVQVLEPMVGGMGARDGADGVDGRDSGISNLSNNPVETVEAELSTTIHRYGLREDSGGAGRWRGGTGLELVFEVHARASLLTRGLERRLFRPWGVAGGHPGARSELVINEGTATEQRPAAPDVIPVAPGDVITLRTAGAGGYGDPLDRKPGAVEADVRAGLVSVAAAERDYGVVVTDGVLDPAATASRRANRRAAGHGVGRGAEVSRWESVFGIEDYDRFVAALMARPLEERSSLRETVLREALDLLPSSFPAGDVEDAAIAGARDRFMTALAAMEA